MRLLHALFDAFEITVQPFADHAFCSQETVQNKVIAFRQELAGGSAWIVAHIPGAVAVVTFGEKFDEGVRQHAVGTDGDKICIELQLIIHVLVRMVGIQKYHLRFGSGGQFLHLRKNIRAVIDTA